MHHAVMQSGTAFADADAKAHDRIPVNACQALNGANGTTLGEGSDDFDLPVEGEDIHGANPRLPGWSHLRCRNYRRRSLYSTKGSSLGGQIPRVELRGRLRLPPLSVPTYWYPGLRFERRSPHL